jgi:hypothetical protein
MTLVPVPSSLRVELSERPPGFTYDIARSESLDSWQSTLSFAIVDEGNTMADGDFSWPYSSVASEQRADDVLAAAEAGLERGCPRARFPRAFGRQVTVAPDLERALGELRLVPCSRAPRGSVRVR